MIAGLTGGIGCGKSTVSLLFAELGWITLSADSICHEIYAEKNAGLYSAITSRWGNKVLTGTGLANNRTIGKIVFNDKQELNWLNRQLHPLIKARAESFINKNSDRDIIFEIPLLYEAGWDSFPDITIAVWAEEHIVLERLASRGLTPGDAKARIRNQADPEEKLSMADYGLINNGSIDKLREQCKNINNKINITKTEGK